MLFIDGDIRVLKYPRLNAQNEIIDDFLSYQSLTGYEYIDVEGASLRYFHGL